MVVARAIHLLRETPVVVALARRCLRLLGKTATVITSLHVST